LERIPDRLSDDELDSPTYEEVEQAWELAERIDLTRVEVVPRSNTSRHNVVQEGLLPLLVWLHQDVGTTPAEPPEIATQGQTPGHDSGFEGGLSSDPGTPVSGQRVDADRAQAAESGEGTNRNRVPTNADTWGRRRITGMVAEVLVVKWLRRCLPDEYRVSWVSRSGEKLGSRVSGLATDEKCSDSHGYDILVGNGQHHWQIEVKGSVEEGGSFRLGATEIAASTRAADRPGEVTWAIIYVSGLSSERCERNAPNDIPFRIIRGPWTDDQRWKVTHTEVELTPVPQAYETVGELFGVTPSNGPSHA
jgi:hypothetical protein